jgi:hypothetical protein
MNYLHLILALGLLCLPASASAQAAGDEEPADESGGDDEASDESGGDDEASDESGGDEAAEESAGDDTTETGEGEERTTKPASDEEAEAEPAENTTEESVEFPDPASFYNDEAPDSDAVVEPTGPTGPMFHRSAADYRSLVTAISFSVGGGRLASIDPGLAGLRGSGDLRYDQFELGVMLLPRLGLSASVMTTNTGSSSVDGLYDEIEGESLVLGVTPKIRSWEVSARLIPTPPFFPIRGYVRAGGGAHHMHLRITDYSADGNLGQYDERGVAGFAVLGLGAEISSPNGVRGHSIPVTAALVLEGGARIGGGGDVVAAPSADLSSFGRLDVGPWYFRAAFKVSFWPKPRVALDAG